MTLAAGTRLGPYEVVSSLGSGGMGEVYRARDPRLGRDVALKVLRAEFAQDQERLWRFRREAQLLAALDHPGIVTIFSVEEYDVPFLTMQLVEGETLEQVIPRAGLPEGRFFEIALPLTDAVAAAHRHGVVHRDLKPSNVMCTREGRVKVLDFGLATLTPARAAQTQTLSQAGQIVGTVPYMSPEQLSGMPLDARTDVFSLGTLLYEMATGTRPFHGATPVAMLTAILSETPRNVGDLRPDLPAELAGIIERCLRKNAAERLASVDELHAALRGMFDDIALRAVRGPRLGPGAHGTGGASIAVLPFNSLSVEPEDAFFADGTAEEIINALGRLPDVKVAARTSSFLFRSKDVDPRVIGEKLGVKTILEGSVRRFGKRLRITAQLVDASSGYHLWSERYDRELDDVFAIQEEIARSIASRLTATLVAGSSDAFIRQGTTDLEAYRLYTYGKTLMDQRTVSGMQRAVPYFREAIDRDGRYALAWSGLAATLVLLEDYQVVAPGSVTAQAQEAIRRALDLDVNLPEAYAALGVVGTLQRDGPAAVAALRRAVELRPGYADAHNWLAWILIVLGDRAAALQSAEKSVELNPLAPEPLSNLGLSLVAAGQLDRGLLMVRRAADIQPNFETIAFYEALALHHMRRFDEASRILERVTVSWAPTSPLVVLGIGRAEAGNREGARACMERLRVRGDFAGIGLIHAAIGDLDAAFAAFDRVDRWEYWGTIAMHNFFDDVVGPLRNDPRYTAVDRAIDASWNVGTEGSKGA
jgi:eukaryotic-like serine/threonine-protein kinase